MRRATLLLLLLLLLLLPLCLSLHAGDDRPGGIVSFATPNGEQRIRVVATGQVFTIDEWNERLAARQPALPRRVKPARKGAQLLTAIARGK